MNSSVSSPVYVHLYLPVSSQFDFQSTAEPGKRQAVGWNSPVTESCRHGKQLRINYFVGILSTWNSEEGDKFFMIIMSLTFLCPADQQPPTIHS